MLTGVSEAIEWLDRETDLNIRTYNLYRAMVERGNLGELPKFMVKRLGNIRLVVQPMFRLKSMSDAGQEWQPRAVYQFTSGDIGRDIERIPLSDWTPEPL